jgi:hypothetical protein
MKRALLLLLGIFSFVSLNAKDFETSTTKTSIYNRYDNAVTFIERGVQFHVFLDGEFEFNNPYGRSRYYDYNGRRFSNKNIRVYRDYRGRITKIGSNRIRYDYRGNVTRIGKVRLYYRQGLLRRVGDLKISYDSWGEPYFYGNVNNYDYYDSDIRFSINIGPIFNYNDRFFYRKNFRNNYRKYREDKHYYYYKARPNARVDKGKKIIKRRKSGVSTRNNNDYKKRRVTPKVQERRKSTKKKTQRRDTNKRYEKRRS